MDGVSQNVLEFEFGIVGDQLELTDDESLLAQIAGQASKLELQVLQEANFAAWREDKAGQFQDFLEELLRELQPRTDDHLARVNVVARLASILEHMDSFRGATLSPFGSFESNLYTRWADLDLSLELPHRSNLPQPITKKVKVKILNSLTRTLIRKGEARKVQFIPYARVPLITFEDSQYSISCDISVDNDAAILKSRLLRWICEVDSRCHDLIFLVKFWAKVHGINDPKMGTLNSFALCLLVIFHLQTRSPPVLPPLSSVLDEDIAKHLKGCENFTEEASKGCWEKIQPFIVHKFGAQNKSSVAELFVTFINQFSAVRELWGQGLAVCTFTGAWGDRGSTCGKWRSKAYMMAIEDPFDRSENCARSVHYKTFDLIVTAFMSTADVISRPVIDTGLSSLVESLFLWPANTQTLGLQAWLSKILSKDGKRSNGQFNLSTVQAMQHHHLKSIEVSVNILRGNNLEAQFRNQLELNNSSPPVQKKKRKKRKKKDPNAVGARGLAVKSPELEAREQNSVYLERIARNANKIRATRKHVVTREGLSPASGDPRAIAGDGLLLETNAKNSPLSIREDNKALTAEHNLIITETHLPIEAARTRNLKVWKAPQKGRLVKHPQDSSFFDPGNPDVTWPAIQRPSTDRSRSCSNEAQHSGDPWPAIRRPSTERSRFLIPQAHTPFVEEISYASATQNRQGSKIRKGWPSLSDSAGASKPIIGGNVGATVPSVVIKANHRVSQGDERFQSRQMHSRAAQVWMPRPMGDKFGKFTSVSEEKAQISGCEPLSKNEKALSLLS